MFKFNVTGDKLHLESYRSLNSGSYGYYTAEFKFDGDWEGIIPHITIIENGTPRVDEVIVDNTFKIQATESGVMMIGIYGIDVNNCKRLSTNYVCIEVKNGAYSGSHYMSKDIWDSYQAAVLSYMGRAENAAADAEESKSKALEAQGISENSAKNAGSYEESAKQYAKTSLLAKNESVDASTLAQEAAVNAIQSAQTAENAKSESILARDAAEEAKEGLEAAESNAKDYATNAKGYAADAKTSADKATESEENAKASEEAVAESRIATEELTNRAESAAKNAEESEVKSSASQKTAEQALSDLLAMINSGDIVLATGGKLPLSSIPATATQEIYVVESEDELTSLTAQRGDLAELVEEIEGERTITKTWQCLGDASVRENWVVWGTSYAVQSGNATTADNAVNANMINNHRLVEMSEEDFASAVKDADTYYLVY